MPRTAETFSYALNHTMLRIRDPKASLPFYQEVLGMDLLEEINLGTFTLYFVGYDFSDGKLSAEDIVKTRRMHQGQVELWWDHGTESDPSFKGFASGNTDVGKGFGHIAVSVDDVQAACKRFDKLGVKFQKRPLPDEPFQYAFILDPDGYWVEIIPRA